MLRCIQFNIQTLRMLFTTFFSIKMASKSDTAKTDFSIDHILNKAGDRFQVCEQKCEEILLEKSFSTSGDESNGCESFGNKYDSNEKFSQVQKFDWLNYTRYNMSRVSRKLDILFGSCSLKHI